MTFVNPYPPGGWGGVMETFVLKTKSYVLKNKYMYFGFVYVIDLAVNLGCVWRSAMLPRLKNSCSGHIVQIISPKFSPAAGLNSGVLYLSYLRLSTDSSGCTAHGNGSNGFTNLLASTDCKPCFWYNFIDSCRTGLDAPVLFELAFVFTCLRAY